MTKPGICDPKERRQICHTGTAPELSQLCLMCCSWWLQQVTCTVLEGASAVQQHTLICVPAWASQTKSTLHNGPINASQSLFSLRLPYRSACPAVHVPP